MRSSSQTTTRRCRSRSRRHEAQQLLHRQRPAEVHVHAGQIVEPVGVRRELPGREVFADLLRAAVQVADVGRHFADDLAVGPQHQPQHAVRAGMLRAHVDQHLVAAKVEFDQFRIDSLNQHFRPSWRCRDIRAAGDNLCAADGRASRPAAGSASESGWPTKRTPIRSKTSRSCQLAVLQTAVTLGTSGSRPGSSSSHRGTDTLSTRRCLWTRLDR